MCDTIISLNKVTKSYQLFWDKVLILKNVNLSIDRNDIVLIYGPSGSGKTTLLNVITGLIDIDQGEVNFCDINIDSITHEKKSEFRAHFFGIVFQERNLISTLTAFENLLFFQELLGGINRSDETKVNCLLKKFDIIHRKNSFPAQLSGGEKKKIALARALVNDPYVLILDEPTGNLDEDSANKLTSIIKELYFSSDINIIIASHDDNLKNIATKIYKIENHSLTLVESYPERKRRSSIKYRPIDLLDYLN